MYDLGPAFENRSVAPGTALLVAGPPLSGVRRRTLDLLSYGLANGEAGLIVTNRYGARWVLEELEGRLDPTEQPLGVVDCVSHHHRRQVHDDADVRYATSPADLTGIGVGFSALLEELSAGTDRVRVVVDSLSTLVRYVTFEAVRGFVNVIGQRLAAVGGIGIHVVEPQAHDEGELDRLCGLFDVAGTVADGSVVGFGDTRDHDWM